MCFFQWACRIILGPPKTCFTLGLECSGHKESFESGTLCLLWWSPLPFKRSIHGNSDRFNLKKWNKRFSRRTRHNKGEGWWVWESFFLKTQNSPDLFLNTSLRDACLHHYRWIFGKVPNGLSPRLPPAPFLGKMLRFFSTKFFGTEMTPPNWRF